MRERRKKDPSFQGKGISAEEGE